MSSPVILVTGAFGALGQVVARHLADQGRHLALVDAAPAAPPALAQDLPDALLLPAADLGQPAGAQQAVAAVLERWGRVDGLVNIAGGFRWETLADGSATTWQQMFALNVLTAVHCCQAVLPAMLAQGSGRIVNVGAAAASKAAAGMGAYTAAKSGVLRLTEALAEETKTQGLNVNAVLPSILDTPANRREMPDADFSRWVAPQALAEVITFLLSDGARAITGAALPVTGRV
jgi:NAD(P)-dependent dehydrogenase (short-subunit alcohol dehydrogenase family)